jgi:hypothetical protein
MVVSGNQDKEQILPIVGYQFILSKKFNSTLILLGAIQFSSIQFNSILLIQMEITSFYHCLEQLNKN